MNCLTNRWLKECVDLDFYNVNDEDLTNLVKDGSLVRRFLSIKLCNFLIVYFKIKDTGPEFC
jgi:hypothetical protein